MQNLNILFLGGAKRVSMARHFKRAASAMGFQAKIFSYELNDCLPIQAEGTVIKGLRSSDPRVLEDLRRVCNTHNISIVIPFIDNMVETAHRLAKMDGVTVFAPTCDNAPMMFDKVVCAQLFESHGIAAPRTWKPGIPVTFPLIAKPRLGSASKGIVFVDSQEDLDALDTQEYLIQERFDNRREFTVDCYASVLAGDIRITACVPRIRNEVAGGEVTRTTTVHWDRATELVREVISSLGLRGAITVQLIHDLDSDRLMVMEINPRLGGGAVAAVCAGADIPAMIISEANGTPAAECGDWKDIIVARYQDEVCFPATNGI